MNIAKENMKVSVPVYSVEGAVVGEYSFVRFELFAILIMLYDG